MQVSHVIRSQEFIASVPRYLDLYQALGIERPLLATVPFIMGPDGKKKLSKRDNAKDVLDYIREGFLPEALDSFIATLGWNDGTEQEIFWGYDFVTGALMHTLGRTGRIDRLSGGLCKSEDFAAVKERLASFMSAGFIALCGTPRKAGGVRSKSAPR